MNPKRLSNGKWLADLQPGGRSGRRIRKQFDTRKECVAFIAHILNGYNTGQPWHQQGRDKRTLSDLCRLWYDLHGHALKEGTERLRSILAVSDLLGNPLASDFTASVFASYRQQRLSSVSTNTVNHEHAYLRAVFGELIRLGHWSMPNPLTKLRRLRVQEHELTYLTKEQITLLLSALNSGRNSAAYYVALVCLATGARWSEAETLHLSSIHKYRVVFEDTKNGKRRSVPISIDLYNAITYNRQPGALFPPCYAAFRSALRRSGISLPPGQSSHVLRHTFASHFMQSGGDILTLQRILGHSSLTMTMRYAHLAPDHLEQALKHNPLSLCRHF